MNWIPKKSVNQFLKWLEISATNHYAQEESLDYLATSMRDFDDVAPHLVDLASGNMPNHTDPGQRLVDLRRVSLADANNVGLSHLGSKVLKAWQKYSVDDDLAQHELPRHLLLTLEALALNDSKYRRIFIYWGSLSNHFNGDELIENWGLLYALNYLEVEHNNYRPAFDFRASSTNVKTLNLDLEKFAKSTAPANKLAINGAIKIQKAINGKVPRGRHRATACIAMELLRANKTGRATLLNSFGIPKKVGTWNKFSAKTISLINQILHDYNPQIAKIAAVSKKKATTKKVAVKKAAAKKVAVKKKVATLKPSSGKAKNKAYEPFELILPSDFDYSSVEFGPPKLKPKKVSKSKKSNAKAGRAKKKDYVGEAESNQAVGKAGEEFVLAYEKNKLKGKPKLASSVVWVSEEIGDDEGYDILSFDDNGQKLHIEVKSTIGPAETDFHISSNELLTAKQLGDKYCIYRVYDLEDIPKIWKIDSPLSDTVELKVSSYRASFKR